MESLSQLRFPLHITLTCAQLTNSARVILPFPALAGALGSLRGSLTVVLPSICSLITTAASSLSLPAQSVHFPCLFQLPCADIIDICPSLLQVLCPGYFLDLKYSLFLDSSLPLLSFHHKNPSLQKPSLSLLPNDMPALPLWPSAHAA